MRRVFLFLFLDVALLAQSFSQRGFFENYSTFYPQTAPNDSSHALSDMLFRYEASYQIAPWLKISGSFDARTDTHDQVERSAHLDLFDRTIERPALSVRRLSLIANKGKFTFEAGRQFIRWGKADLLNPTDRFAPKDYLNVVEPEFLGVWAARLTYESGSNTVDMVWQPVFTPARTPLLDQRWTVLPSAAAQLAIEDIGARYPTRSQWGARWNHNAAGYEYSFSYFDGYNYLPLFNVFPGSTPLSAGLQRYYPRLRLYGGDAAFPTRIVTIKAEAAYYTTTRNQTDEYLLYVLQLERQQGEWSFVGGYAGEVVTNSTGNPLQFSPERGFARSFLGRTAYTISPTKSVSIQALLRQNGRGAFVQPEYSQTFGQHWRLTTGFTLIRGNDMDFIGQYHRNSFASLTVRYSF